MISYQIVEHGKPLQRTMLQTPKPTGSEVLMRITRSGVCHSDVHIWEGFFDLGGGKRFYVKERGCIPPFTLGHEPFGIVEKIGPRVKGVKVGQNRLIHPWIGCGKCAVCKAGQDNYCVSGSRIIGVNRAGACAKLPPLTPGDRVAVIGCGGVGLAGIAVLRAKGVKNIVACDIDETKLAAAGKLGAKFMVNTRAADAAQQLQGIAGAIDFVGTPATAALGIAALRKGGRYVLVGLHGGELVHPLPPIAQRAIGIVGSYVGNLQELKAVVALAKKGKLKPMPVETRPAQEVNGALQDLNAGRVVGRVVLDFERLAA